MRIAEEINYGDVPVTISIGLASWPEDGIGHTDIIAAADASLYKAKRGGGNQSCQASGTVEVVKAVKPEETNAAEAKPIRKYWRSSRALSDTVDARSYYTFNHSELVTEYALALGKSLKLGTGK